MTTLLITHPACLAHEPGPGHPERPERLRAIEAALAAPPFDRLSRLSAPQASLAQLTRVHPPSYVESIMAASPHEGRVQLDADTFLSPGSVDAALHGAGGAILAVERVMSGRAANAFVATRPPGHHAETATAMGFCIFNNVAIAARHAKQAFGAQRIAIVDFYVHHGNGTQAIFWNDPNVLYASTHEMPHYPGTGAPSERGAHDQIVNAPLRAGDDGVAFREAFEVAILPRLATFAPDLLIISAGFDAHCLDPLGDINLVADDFAWVTQRLREVADIACGGRIVSVLEGGYDLTGLAQSTAAHVGVLMES